MINNSSKTREAYAEKLQRLGLGCPAEPGAGPEVFGKACYTSLYLQQHLEGSRVPAKVYMLGSLALAAELEAMGISVEMAVLQQAKIIGKPSWFIFDCVVKEFSLNLDHTFMVGDWLDTDNLLGVTRGLKTILTLTGVSSLQDMNGNQRSDCSSRNKIVPDFYVDSIADLIPALED